MAKYVDDGFLTALVVRARGFCTGEFHSQINPEIAQAYLDAAEALGADPNKGNILMITPEILKNKNYETPVTIYDCFDFNQRYDIYESYYCSGCSNNNSTVISFSKYLYTPKRTFVLWIVVISIV